MPVVYITDRCDLRCSYCFVKKGHTTMSWQTAKKTVDFLGSLDYERRVISLFGGEPLVEWPLVKKLVNYVEKTGKFTDVFLCTNGTFMDEEKIKYFVKHQMTPQISLDGTSIAHDRYRVDKAKKGSFHSLNRNLILLGKKYINKMKNLHIRITMTPKNIPYLYETIKYIISINLIKAQINFMPDVHMKYTSQDFKKLEGQMIKIAKLIKFLKSKGKNLDVHYNECITSGSNFKSMNKANWKPFCELGGQMLSIDLKGDIYPCYIAAGIRKDRRKDLKMGNIYEGITYPSKLIDLNLSDTSKTINPCLSCLAWNYEQNGKLLEPVNVYKEIYKSWVKGFELMGGEKHPGGLEYGISKLKKKV